LTRQWQVTGIVAKTAFSGSRSLKPAAEMAVLFDGIASTLPFLLVR
jgi:hypothetical protein